MNGRMIYFALAALLGVLCSLVSFILFFFLVLVYLSYLVIFKRFSFSQPIGIIAVFMLFLIASQLVQHQNKTKIPQASATFQLEYIENPKIEGNLLQIIAQDTTTDEKVLLHYTIAKEEEKKELEERNFYGCICQITGSLELPKQAKNENAFNYREYLKEQHIFWIVKSKNMPLGNCRPHKLNVLTFLRQERFFGISELKRHFPPEVAALSAALIYGDQGLMSPELVENYQKMGISHLLAISGLHVSLLVGMIFYLGIRVGITRGKMTSMLLFILPVYAVLTGGSPSVLRSVLMIFLILASLKWQKQFKLLSIDAVCISFLLLLFINPLVIFNVGFQLSYIVSFTIIISGPKILQRYQNRFLQMLTVSIVSQLASLPFMLYHFFTVNLLSIFANIIYIPLYSCLFLPGVFILYFIQIMTGRVPELLLTFFANILHISTVFSETLSQTSFGQFTPGRPGVFFLLIYGAIIIAIFILAEQKFSTRHGKRLFLLFIVLFQFQPCWNKLYPIGEIDMIDVGQGDSIFIHLPFGRGNFLIDTGGVLPFQSEAWEIRTKTFEPGKDIIVPFLRGKGINQIDKLILTHGDMDHIGGALSLIKEIKIKQILFPDVKERSETEAAIVKAAEEKGIQVCYVSSGQGWKSDVSQFFILSPEKNFGGDKNRGSLTILASAGGLNWFFGGDLDQEGEEEIVKKYPKAVIDVLKVGHHGSRTSSSPVFLNKYKPKTALISAGENNRFGHPHQEALAHLKEIGAKVYRTDTQGEISFRFFHGKGTFNTYLP